MCSARIQNVNGLQGGDCLGVGLREIVSISLAVDLSSCVSLVFKESLCFNGRCLLLSECGIQQDDIHNTCSIYLEQVLRCWMCIFVRGDDMVHGEMTFDQNPVVIFCALWSIATVNAVPFCG